MNTESDQPTLPALGALIAVAPDAPTAKTQPATSGGFDITRQFAGNSIRILGTPDEPLFVAKDVCAALGLENVSRALDSLESDEMITLTNCNGNPRAGIPHLFNVVTESGLYALIFKSRKDEAKRFRVWVTSEVLPSIRKTGVYGVSVVAALDDPSTLRTLLLTNVEDRLALAAEVSVLTPKGEAFDRIGNADGLHNLTNTAKLLQIRPKELFTYVDCNSWTYTRPGSSDRIAYQQRIQQGFLTHKVMVQRLDDGTERVRQQVLVTAKGLTKLATVFGTTINAEALSL